MHLGISKSKNSTSLYVIKSTYDNGFHSTKIVEKLGTVKELEKTLNGEDPIVWAKKHIAELNKAEKTQKHEVTTKYSSRKLIAKDVQRSFNGGYLFLKKIYNELGFPQVCNEIKKKHHLNYDFNAIFADLLFCRIIFPTSSVPYYDCFCMFIEQPTFTRNEVTNALKILAKEKDTLRRKIYDTIIQHTKINTGVLYYDTTMCLYESTEISMEMPNIPFEIYFDGNMIPLTYRCNPLHKSVLESSDIEKDIQNKFEHSHVITTSDSRITTGASKTFKDWKMPNSYIMTMRLDHLHENELKILSDSKHWICSDTGEEVDLGSIKRGIEMQNSTRYYYKDIKTENQRTVLTYSAILEETNRIEKEIYSANQLKIPNFEALNTAMNAKVPTYMNGISAYTTNLEYEPMKIVQIAGFRTQANLLHRILSMEKRDNHSILTEEEMIDAHFITCFSALVLSRTLINNYNLVNRSYGYIEQLRKMNFMKIAGEGYVPLYTRNNLTDIIHEAAGFRTDYEIISSQYMNSLIKQKI